MVEISNNTGRSRNGKKAGRPPMSRLKVSLFQPRPEQLTAPARQGDARERAVADNRNNMVFGEPHNLYAPAREAAKLAEVVAPSNFQNADTTGLLADNARPTLRAKDRRLRDEILEIHRRLSTERSLLPTERVSRLFEALVRLISPYQPTAIVNCLLDDRRIRRVHKRLIEICAAGEYELEKHWAHRINSARRPKRELARFPYFSNYQSLTRLEGRLLRSFGGPGIGRVLFVGSGPLPLSSVLLARYLGIAVDTVDASEEACRLSKALVSRLDMADAVTIRHADLREVSNLRDYDAVILAALVGLCSREKRSLIKHLRNSVRPGCLLVLRSANNLRQLIYPKIQPVDLLGMSQIFAVHPRNEIINSVLIVEKRSVRINILDGPRPSSVARTDLLCTDEQPASLKDAHGRPGAHRPVQNEPLADFRQAG